MNQEESSINQEEILINLDVISPNNIETWEHQEETQKNTETAASNIEANGVCPMKEQDPSSLILYSILAPTIDVLNSFFESFTN